MRPLLYPIPILLRGILPLCVCACLTASAPGQTAAPASGDSTLDKQREIIQGRIPFDAAMDKNSDGKIDVRDMALYINGKPVSATFGSAETLVFHSAGSVTLPVYFTKPVTGTIRLDLGGDATEGTTADFTILYQNTAQRTFTVSNAKSLEIPIQLRPWRGTGGEKVIRLTINRDAAILPENGVFSTHMLRIRQFEKGEFVGLLTFPSGSGLPTLPVRIGLGADGSGICSFQQTGSLLGPSLSFSWQSGVQGFPEFSGSISVTIPGESLGRPAGAVNSVKASLAIQRMGQPYGEQLDAYLDGFPAEDRPALYHATFTFHNLIAAGARFATSANPYAVIHQGRLTLQPVRYAAAP